MRAKVAFFEWQERNGKVFHFGIPYLIQSLLPHQLQLTPIIDKGLIQRWQSRLRICLLDCFEKQKRLAESQASEHRFVKTNEYSQLVLDGNFLSHSSQFVFQHQEI